MDQWGTRVVLLVGQVAANDTIKENYPKVRKGGALLDLRKPQRACALTSEKDDSPTEKGGGIKKSTGPAFGLGMASLPSLLSKKNEEGWKLKRGKVRGKGKGEGQHGQRGLKSDGRGGKGE